MFSPVVLVYVAMVTAVSARTVSDGASLLMDQVQAIANSLPESPRTAPDSSSSGVYIPGRSDICDPMCPKWCQKINGTTTDTDNCHYLCGNICFDMTTSVHPFIGTGRYEVVASDFSFSHYDLDGNKMISAPEFSLAERVPLEEVMDLFLFSDVNGDGYIDHQEFQGGPLVFTVQMAAELSAMAIEEPKTTTQPPQ